MRSAIWDSGRVFTANMTGNVVFVGFALGGADDVSIVRPSISLAAFAAGSAVGGRMVNVRDRHGARHLLRAMSMEMGAAALIGTVVLRSVGTLAAYLSAAVVVGPLAWYLWMRAARTA